MSLPFPAWSYSLETEQVVPVQKVFSVVRSTWPPMLATPMSCVFASEARRTWNRLPL